MPLRNRIDNKKGKIPDPAFILEKIRHFCSYRERSEKETELKLKAMQLPTAGIRGIIVQLREEGFISDERFARAFVRGKWRVNRWGMKRITFELRSKRIPEKLISLALMEIDEDAYREVLERVIWKKALEIRPKLKEENNSGNILNFRDKLFNFALGKGYESDLIREILDELKI
ncbi:MAG: regulatory protein RecX [Bacteroidetes bacterium]|nr:regulatory protein RecX [Bacteroidota bacterium]